MGRESLVLLAELARMRDAIDERTAQIIPRPMVFGHLNGPYWTARAEVMSAPGWEDPTRSGQLAADIEKMVAHLVDGVHCNPLQRSFARFRIVVDDAARPVAGTQPVKHVGEHLRRVSELAGDVLGVLLGIAVVVDSLVSAHGWAVRLISPAGGEDPLALDKEHVSQMTAVFQGRPCAGLPSSPQIDDGMAPQDCHDLGDPFPDHPPGH